jgi:hypothetical protein
MSDITHRKALADFEYEIMRAIADLEIAIDAIVGVDEYAEDDILTKEDDGSISVDVAELKALFERLDDASEAADDASKEFDQEVDRVWRRFKQALVHSEVEVGP